MFAIDDVLVTAAHTAAEIQSRPVAQPRAHADVPTGDVVLAGVAVHVPSSYRADRPAGVAVMLHGAGGDANQALALVKRHAAAENLIVVAPKSDDATWDVIGGGLGPDVAAIDHALAAVFTRYAVDPARVAIGGFSDGASYALTLGLANGSLFQAILAFSPGFQAAPRQHGRPRIFISHGTADRVLPIARTSHRLVPLLRRANYSVEYFEFAGGHTVPADAIAMALELLATR